MAISSNLVQRQLASIKESSATPGQPGQVVLNPDGSSVGSSAALITGATSTRTTKTPALTSAELIAANTGRRGLRVIHTAVDQAQRCWISTGTASSTSYLLLAQGSWELNLFDAVEWPYTGAYTFISDVASGTTQIFQLT